MAAKFMLQTSHCEGTYSNPFKRGGQGLRYSPWKTKQSFDTLEAAKEAWVNFKNVGLERRRITHGGKVLVTPEGRVYEVEVVAVLDLLSYIPSAETAERLKGKTKQLLRFKDYMPGCQ